MPPPLLTLDQIVEQIPLGSPFRMSDGEVVLQDEVRSLRFAIRGRQSQTWLTHANVGIRQVDRQRSR